VIGLLRKFPEIKVFQVIQKSILQICVRYVAEGPVPPETEEQIRAEFAHDLGEQVKVAFEHVAEISRASSGKFMVTVSEVSG